ncbi:MFS transporter [Phenylobacterium sp. SCN 70-31]|uniref:spinster family MFS transporter n=1 Tax=Phenylobacterium sp. SCN 70-31 TaxID=1660129 RepID=UPI000A9AB5C6|nr:MFS transporter [Phenylobacterium sp. SCN 70-31]
MTSTTRQTGLTPLPLFLFLMFLTSTANMADRQVIGIVAEQIKLEFGLSDTMLSLISGTAFALVYPPLGLPLAWLADRRNRRNLLVGCLSFWSAATVACGFAPGFWTLFLARMGVAVGEAGYAPCTHSLIADYTSAERRARAFSVLLLGISAGGLFASVVGGFAAEHYGWRAAFVAVGLPGFLTAIAILWFVKEPLRQQAHVAPPPALQTLKRLLSTPAFTFCITGSAVHLMVTYAKAAWAVAFFMRVHGLSVSEAAILVGSVGAVAGAIGTVAGGIIGDRLAVIDRRWLAWWPAITVLLGFAVGAPAFLTGNLLFAVAGVSVAVFLNALYQPSTYALVQTVAQPRERATAAALMIFIQNITGLGLGPLLTGLLSDRLAPVYGVQSLGYALAAVFGLNIVAAVLYVFSGRAFGRG